MNDLQNAQLIIETRLSIESDSNDGNWFYLDDYSSLDELFADCAGWFMFEDNPEYVFKNWENIPDCMIKEDWISPNFFVIRDGLQQIDESYRNLIWEWCQTYGWDMANDDPHKILTEFEYAMCGMPKIDDGNEYNDEEDSYLLITHTGGGSFEMFNDDYN